MWEGKEALQALAQRSPVHPLLPLPLHIIVASVLCMSCHICRAHGLM